MKPAVTGPSTRQLGFYGGLSAPPYLAGKRSSGAGYPHQTSREGQIAAPGFQAMPRMERLALVPRLGIAKPADKSTFPARIMGVAGNLIIDRVRYKRRA